MISTWSKAIASSSMVTQMELPKKLPKSSVAGTCLSLALKWMDSRDDTCVQCDQVDDLLSLVAKLKEEGEKLRTTRECEKEIDCWSHILQSIREMQ